MSHRSTQLYNVVDKLNRVHDEWSTDKNRPYPDEAYWDAIDEIFTAFGTGDIPEDCRELATAVNELAEEDEKFENRTNVANLYPHEEFWMAREKVAEIRKRPKAFKLPPLESIKTLHDQKVSHEQIARMYGLMKDGVPQPHLVQLELDQPGSVITKDWKDPRLNYLSPEVSALARQSQAIAQKAAAAAAAAAPCPETPYELWQQGVSVDQAALMLRQPTADVANLFARFASEKAAKERGEEDLGLSADDSQTEVADDNVADRDGAGSDPDDPTDAEDGDEVDSIDQAIIELHREGRSSDSIKEEFKKEGKEIDGRKIAAVIRAYKARTPAAPPVDAQPVPE